jgi:DNA mismatch endonuclease, patch repair protein
LTDRISKDQRSANMRAVRTRHTEPEMCVRRIARQLGYRFRLHWRNLPGKPDLTFTQQQKVIYVHGCFWHQHQGCRRGSAPQSNVAFWRPKLARNKSRDAEQLAAVKRRGWRALVVWECQTKDEGRLAARLNRFLGDASQKKSIKDRKRPGPEQDVLKINGKRKDAVSKALHMKKPPTGMPKMKTRRSKNSGDSRRACALL